MSDVQLQTIPRVYLRDPRINRTSGMHTIWIGEEGKPGKLHSMTFIRGVAEDVPLAVYERFRDAGHVTTDRPSPIRGDER